MRMRFVPCVAAILLAGLAAPVRSFGAAGLTQNGPQDRIEVLGPFHLAKGPISRLLVTQHYGRYYLYAEDAGEKSVTVMDVTNAKAPSLVANVSYPASDNSDDLLAVSGMEVVTGTQDTSAAAVPQSIRIMNLADPAHPAVVREITGVTAIGRDRQRGLVFLASPAGVWILRERPALDPATARAYTNYVLYDR